MEKITATTIKHLDPGKTVSDSEVRGFRARRLPSGLVSYGFQYRAEDSRLRWVTLQADTPDDARRLAKVEAGKIAKHEDPAAERDRKGADNVDTVLDKWIEQHVQKNELRSGDRIVRDLAKHVRPTLGGRSIYTLKRRDMVDLLDEVEKQSGDSIADQILSYLTSCFRWWMIRDEDFTSPIIPGLRRVNRTDRARTRILNDEEIRDLWRVLDQLEGVPEWFPSFIRIALLTGQRKGNVGAFHSREIKDGNWEIPAEKRRKLVHGHVVPLSAPVLDIIQARGDGFLFVSRDADREGDRERGERWARPMRALHAALAELRKREGREPFPHFVIHDLRRTARSLMSRMTTPDTAERVIGHHIGGIRGIYDRYKYIDEKREALDRLARYVVGLVGPQGGKVVAFSGRGRGLARPATRTARRRAVGG